MVESEVREIKIKVHIAWIEKNGLPNHADSLGSVANVLVGRGSKFQGLCVRLYRPEQRSQRSKGVMWFMRRELDGSEQVTFACVVRMKCKRARKDGRGF